MRTAISGIAAGITAPARAPRADDAGVVVRIERSFRAMGTTMSLVAHVADDAAAARAFDAAEGRIRAIESRFSRFSAGSELSRLNALGGAHVIVSAEMAAVLDLAMRSHVATGGLFDPAVLPDLERAGYDRTFDAIGAADAPAPPSATRRTFAEVGISGRLVHLPAGLRIDLGGIVKGWTADRIADLLAPLGPVAVDLGGDIALRGTPPSEDAWTIAVERPDGLEGPLAVLRLPEGAVATSGTYRRTWMTAAGPRHHLIDPRSGEPAESDLVAVVALHAHAAVADVWAKSILLERAERRAALIASCAGLEAILVPASGAPVATSGAAERCVSGATADVAA